MINNLHTDSISKTKSPEARWQQIMSFCELVKRETQGPLVAVKILGAYMQSTDESVALQSLDILQTCARRCGPRFQSEVGKFRFLNEVVKLVSPRHLGRRTADKVKNKAVELLYVWTQLLPYEPKIKEAYDMLKSQNLISEDPDVPLFTDIGPEAAAGEPSDNNSAASASKHATADDIFQQDERSQRLQKLLKSRAPEDLKEANRLIKRIVSDSEQKQEKVCKRVSELGRMQTIVKVLSEMLDAYGETRTSGEEKETLQQLYSSCKELRTSLSNMASQTADSEKDALGS
jgi:ADP-ribosylation factor-binding protein GGA